MSDPYEICAKCPSAKKAVCDRSLVNKKYKYALVVDFPNVLEMRKGRLLEGDTGQLVKAVLKKMNVNLKDVYVTSALNCVPGKGEKKQRIAAHTCAKRLIGELRNRGVDRVLCLGPLGFTALRGAKRVPNVTKAHGRWYPAYGMEVMVTYAPFLVLNDPELFRDFVMAIEKLFRPGGRQRYPRVKHIIPETIAEMKEAFALLEAAEVRSCDVETTGFSAYKDDLLAVGFAILNDPRPAIVVTLDEALLDRKSTWKRIANLINDDGILALHNAKFDLKFLKLWIEDFDLEWDPQCIEDTMLLHYCIDERPMGKYQSHSLKNLARIRYDAPDYDINMGKWLKEWAKADELTRRGMRAKMHTYLALDCYYTARLLPDLSSEVAFEGMMDVYDDILIPGMHALVDIEMYGAKIDRAYLESTKDKLASEGKRLLELLRDITMDPEFNPGSPQQVSKYLFSELALPKVSIVQRGKRREGPTSHAALRMLALRHPEHAEFLNGVLEYRNVVKTAGTYVNGILNRLDDDDRIRGDFLQIGTATGRLSSSNPNLQNQPLVSHTKIDIRRAFIADKDKVLAEGDYSQLELRIVAHLADDKALKEVYKQGLDLHQTVAGALYQKSKEEISPYQRWLAKQIVFGVLYGSTAKSIAEGSDMDRIANEYGGKRWTIDDVQLYFDRFFEEYTGFRDWQKQMIRTAYKEHLVVSAFGRKRRFPFVSRFDGGLIGRQGVNMPVQSTAADCTFLALIKLHEHFKKINMREGYTVAHIVLTVHDSIMIEFDPDFEDEIRELVLLEMEQNVPLETDVPFKVDFNVGSNWTALK